MSLLNIIRREVARYMALQSSTRPAIIDSYDPVNHAATVRFQPEDVLSGWLPVGTAMAGNGYGVFFAPSPGDQVQVNFYEGNFDTGIIGLRYFSDVDRPLNVPSGNMWLVDPSGSSIKLTNNGTIIIAPETLLEIMGNTSITGNLMVSGSTKLGTGALSPVETAAGPSTTVKAV